MTHGHVDVLVVKTAPQFILVDCQFAGENLGFEIHVCQTLAGHEEFLFIIGIDEAVGVPQILCLS